jgi:hypothetical protein
MTHDFKLSDLCTVVPATTSAWISIIECFEYPEEDGSITKTWHDVVLPVLAYGTLTGGWGAFLVCKDSEGPAWLMWNPLSGYKSTIKLSVGKEPPNRGVPDRITKEYDYRHEPLDDFYGWDGVYWIID